MYKRNSALPLHAQMISAAPDVVVEPIQEDDLFFVLACDGIWKYVQFGLSGTRFSPAIIMFCESSVFLLSHFIKRLKYLFLTW